VGYESAHRRVAMGTDRNWADAMHYLRWEEELGRVRDAARLTTLFLSSRERVRVRGPRQCPVWHGTLVFMDSTPHFRALRPNVLSHL